ncbi:MAG: EthD domain-containing protein [Deltaproteobacteria bacterium]|nr:EthD domain-containing protein [Deltaproteobacteria bacterium]
MVKFIICAKRKEGMTHEEFSAYWRNHHGPLVRSVPEFIRHVKKYVQCHLVKGALPLGAAGDYDGVAELWFDSVESLTTAFNEPRYLAIIRPDELTFADLSKSISFVTEEVPVV